MQTVKSVLREMEAYKEEQRRIGAPLLAEALREAQEKEQKARQLRTIPKNQRPPCGARTRAGRVCQARALHGSERCKRHGGRSSTVTAAYRRLLREEAAYLRLLVKVCQALMG